MADEKEQAKPDVQAKPQRKDERRGATSIVRIAGKDVDGSLSITRALREIKGISFSMAQAMSSMAQEKLGINASTAIGSLSEEQTAKLEALIKEPAKAGVPKFLLNRRKDFETGEDMHTVGNDLIFSTRQDVSRDITIKAWRGMRHQYGQKVRGQHTRSTGRTGATVGVVKKAVLQKPGAVGAPGAPGVPGAAGAQPAQSASAAPAAKAQAAGASTAKKEEKTEKKE
jgi:small subunit ribosomal protein S13